MHNFGFETTKRTAVNQFGPDDRPRDRARLPRVAVEAPQFARPSGGAPQHSLVCATRETSVDIRERSVLRKDQKTLTTSGVGETLVQGDEGQHLGSFVAGDQGRGQVQGVGSP